MATHLHLVSSIVGDVPLFSASHARGWGISPKELTALCRRGQLRRLMRGWYTTRVGAGPDELHVLRTVAALQMHGAGVGAHRHSAALLHGLPLARADLSTVELVRPSITHGRTREGVRVSDSAKVELQRVEVASTGRVASVVDVAHAVVGTAASSSPLAGLVAGDHALRHRLCTRTQVEQALSDLRGCTGIREARLALAQLEPRHESPGETVTAWELGRLGWDLEPQVEVVARGRLYRLDFTVRGLKVAVEFDGKIKYVDPEVLVAQERREADLRSEGWTFARFGWDDLVDPLLMQSRMRAAVAELGAVS